MFEKAGILFLYCETPVHAGAGVGLGLVDLPIQRERITGLPIIQSSSIKGVLRTEVMEILKARGDAEAEAKVRVLFGPETQRAHSYAGCVSPHDARLLLFPIRSLVGVFAWATCPLVLERFKRELKITGFSVEWQVPRLAKDSQKALVTSGETLVGKGNGKVVLEEFAFEAEVNEQAREIAEWLRTNAFPEGGDYEVFREWLVGRLVILPDDAFRDFTQLAIEVITRIRLKEETKTVEAGGLWSEEHLPSETVLYAPVLIGRPLAPKEELPQEFVENGRASGRKVLEFFRRLSMPDEGKVYLERLQIGGDETVGRGLVRVRWSTPKE